VDKKELLEQILDIESNWVAVSGVIDIVKLDGRFVCRSDWNKDEVNPLSIEFTKDDFYVIIGKGNPDYFFEALFEFEYNVDKEGVYEFHALLKYYHGDYDEHGRMTYPDSFDIEHIELKLIETFEERNRNEKLYNLLTDDLDLFNI